MSGGGGGGGGIALLTGYAVTADTYSVIVGGSAANANGGLSEFGIQDAAYLIRGNGGSRGSSETGGTGGTGLAAEGLTSTATFTGKNGRNGTLVAGKDSAATGSDLDVGLFQSQSWGGGGGGGRVEEQGQTATNTSTPNSGGGGGGGAASTTRSQTSGLTGELGIVIIRTRSPLTPTFSSPLRNDDGFTVNVTNYDANYTWALTVSAGATVSPGVAFGSIWPLTITGLPPGASATVTVTTARISYPSGSATLTSHAKNAQNVHWSPETALTMPGTTVTPAAATALGGVTIRYSVQSAGTTGCTLDPETRALTYISTGVGVDGCVVRAAADATTDYASGVTDVTFTISLGSQTITASAVSTSLRPGQSTSVSSSGSSGTGAITWALTSGADSCTLTGTTVRAVADGTCVLTVSIAADDTYGAATGAVTIAVTTPRGGGGGGGGGSSSGGSGGESGSGSGSAAASAAGSGGAVQSQDDVPVPGTDAPTRGRTLPPPPAEVEVAPVGGVGTRSAVIIRQPAGVAGSQVKATVIVVRNDKGRIVSRINVELEPGQSILRVTVPYVAEGYLVNVYNANEVGVSTGAIERSPLVRATTITQRGKDQKPSLFGTQLGRPIIFTSGSAKLSSQAKRQLNAIARNANARGERLFITGFAHKSNTIKNEPASLSTRRAHAAAKYLSQRGVRVWIRYWGAGSLNGTGTAFERRAEVRTSPNQIPPTLVP
jgi:hypothetical protein